MSHLYRILYSIWLTGKSHGRWGLWFHLALATRAKVFKELSEKHSRVYGFHLAFPGLGRVVATETGHRWALERYEWK